MVLFKLKNTKSAKSGLFYVLFNLYENQIIILYLDPQVVFIWVYVAIKRCQGYIICVGSKPKNKIGDYIEDKPIITDRRNETFLNETIYKCYI